jgi:hypothetical protein
VLVRSSALRRAPVTLRVHCAVRAVHVIWEKLGHGRALRRAVVPRQLHGAVRAVLLPTNSALGCAHGAVCSELIQAGSVLGRAVAPRNAHCAVLPVL